MFHFFRVIVLQGKDIILINFFTLTRQPYQERPETSGCLRKGTSRLKIVAVRCLCIASFYGVLKNVAWRALT